MPRMARAEDRRAASTWYAKPRAGADKCVGLLLDLGGPKIRIECFRDGSVLLRKGQPFALDTALDPKGGNDRRGRHGLQEPAARMWWAGTYCCCPTGRSCWTSSASRARASIRGSGSAGQLSDRKGLNRQGGGISAPALSDKDRDDIRFAAEEKLDYVAVSFARDAADIELARAPGARSGR